jgi:16S rRNA (guanine527-N7)-methyltransferase
MWTFLESVAQLAGGLSEEQASVLRSYCDLVRDAGSRWNLMAPSALARVEEHVVDSAAALVAVDLSEASVADLGSGAGLPGIVLSVLRPGWRTSLVDSRRSKAVFLREAVRVLRLGNAVVVHDRVEALGGAGFDLALSRALGSIESTLVPSLRTIRAGGQLVLYKGPRWTGERARAEELARGAGGLMVAEKNVGLPGLNRATTFVTFTVGGDGDA